MTEIRPEDKDHHAYDDLFGVDVDEDYVGEELSDDEVKEILNG